MRVNSIDNRWHNGRKGICFGMMKPVINTSAIIIPRSKRISTMVGRGILKLNQQKWKLPSKNPG
jgi:hypothetical protein